MIAMLRLHKVARWLFVARTAVPDALWVFVVMAASLCGFVVGVVFRGNGCGDDPRPLALALGGEATFVLGATIFTIVRCVRHRISGSTLAIVLVVMGLLSAAGGLWTWLGLGLCFRGFAF